MLTAIKKAKNGPIFKIQAFICIKSKFSGGQFYKEISKFGYFKKWEKVRKITKVSKVEHLRWKVRWMERGNDKKTSPGWVDVWMDLWKGVKASFRITYSNKNYHIDLRHVKHFIIKLLIFHEYN